MSNINRQSVSGTYARNLRFALLLNTAILIAELARGFAAAVAETGLVNASTVAAWSALSRSGAIVGHTDTLALPSHHGRC